jgi:phosphatidylserine decarboxylase
MCETIVLSPAEGRVCAIERGPTQKISVFLALWDNHVNCSPIAGQVERILHTPGRYLPALFGSASRRNENNWIAIRGEHFEVGVRQIAGMVARRIVCDCREGDRLEAGQRLGEILFGSRVDLHLPKHLKILVRMGQRVRVAETIVAA